MVPYAGPDPAVFLQCGRICEQRAVDGGEIGSRIVRKQLFS